jgi:hypothetical protein
MDLVANAQALFSKFNAADILWILGAVILAILAIKVVAKIVKFLLVIGAVLLVIVFVFSSGLLPF